MATRSVGPTNSTFTRCVVGCPCERIAYANEPARALGDDEIYGTHDSPILSEMSGKLHAATQGVQDMQISAPCYFYDLPCKRYPNDSGSCLSACL